MASSSDEDDDGSMLKEHKVLLNDNLDALSGMNTEVVLRQLEKRGVVAKYDIEQVNAYKTTVEKNGCLLDKLQRRGPSAFDHFFEVLRLSASSLAEKLLPVCHRILWFAPSPSLAAMVEYTLTKYENVSFSNIEGRKSPKKYLQKRGRVFVKKVDFKSVQEIDEGHREEYVKYSQDCEVTLAFPIADRADLIQSAMEAVLKESSSFDMFVMSGVCEGVRSGGESVVRGGEVVIATEVYSHPGIDLKVCPREGFVEVLRRELTECFRTRHFPWSEEVRAKLTSPIGEHPRPLPHFGTVCSSPLNVDTPSTQPSVSTATFLASDSHTFTFYEQCQKIVGTEKPWFSCLGVHNYTSLNNEDFSQDDSCTLASTGVALELCRLWYNRSQN